MIRFGLFLYLMLATAAGPGLCCCVADRLGNMPAKETPTKKCCRNHHDGKKEAPAKDPSAACPCKQDRVSPNPVLTMERGDGLGYSSFQFASVLGLSALKAPVTDVNTATPRNLAFSNLDAREVLRAIHVLRC